MIPRLKVSSSTRVMVFAPHPDDETLGVGGVLQHSVNAGAAVRVVYLTDGDNNPWMQGLAERRWPGQAEDRVRWGRLRRREALAALSCLGVPEECALFLGYPDQGLTALLLRASNSLAAQLVDLMEGWCPNLVVAPSTWDLHPDHSALSVLVRMACLRLPQAVTSRKILTYRIHSRRPEASHGGLLQVELSREQKALKRKALLCHSTQLLLGAERWLKYVTDHEVFASVEDREERLEHHPIRGVVEDQHFMRLYLENKISLGALGTRTLHLLCVPQESGDGPVGPETRLEAFEVVARIPSRTRRLEVFERPSGRTVRHWGEYRGDSSCGEVKIPRAAFYGTGRIYAKIGRRFGFFDEGGWMEVLVKGRKHLYDACNGAGIPESTEMAAEAIHGQEYSRPFVCCVIPCYNVAEHCEEVVRAAMEHADLVIAVDDGSSDGTGNILHEIETESGSRLKVVSHWENRGKGVALIAGFQYALKHVPFHWLVTLDGDRQHRPSDIPRLMETALAENAEMVIGERTAAVSNIPFRSRIGNTLATQVMRWIYPGGPSDTQSGFRAFKRGFLEEIVQRLQGGRYETEAYILMMALENGRKIARVPIHSIYLDGNSSSHFRPMADALRILSAYLKFQRLKHSHRTTGFDSSVLDVE